MKTPSPKAKLYGLSLDASLLVLTTLRDAARVAPVPYLMEAADLALGILSAVQSMKDCKEGYKRLASDSCGLVYAVVGTQAEAAFPPDDLGIHVGELLGTLQSIYTFSRKELKRNTLSRMIRFNSDCGKILEYREALRQSLDVFGLQSTVSIRDNIARIIKNQDEIVRHLERRSTQDSNIKQLLAEAFENTRARKMSSLLYPLHIDTPNAPQYPDNSLFTSYSHVTGNFVLEDKSYHLVNSNSNNTVTTITLDSNNDSSVRFY